MCLFFRGQQPFENPVAGPGLSAGSAQWSVCMARYDCVLRYHVGSVEG